VTAGEAPDKVVGLHRARVVAEHGRYLYAVSRGLDIGALGDLLGLSDGVLEKVVVKDLTGIVSSVGLDEYGEEGLRRNLERLDWLETAARGHDAVVQAAAAVAPTAPMRLATIFLDDEGVRERLATQYDAISDVLDRVEGQEEWSVKVLTHSLIETPAPLETVGSGAEYLRRRREERDARRVGVDEAHVAAERVHEALASLSTATRRLAPQDPRLTGHTGTMVHNAAYLVPVGCSEDFVVAIGEQTTEHPDVVVDARGPWPPYSFAMLDEQ
jgi:hypothetical protein